MTSKLNSSMGLQPAGSLVPVVSDVNPKSQPNKPQMAKFTIEDTCKPFEIMGYSIYRFPTIHLNSKPLDPSRIQLVPKDKGDSKGDDVSQSSSSSSSRNSSDPRASPSTISLSKSSSSSLNDLSSGSLSPSMSLSETRLEPKDFCSIKDITECLVQAKKDNSMYVAFTKQETIDLEIFIVHFLKDTIAEAAKDPSKQRLPRGTVFEHAGIKYKLPRTLEIVFDPATKQPRACLALNLKTKNNQKNRITDILDKLVGNGAYKRAKFAIDLCRGELIVRLTMLNDQMAQNELMHLLRYSGHYGMIALLGYLEFLSKAVDKEGNRIKKLAIFLPYCQLGDLRTFVKNPKLLSKLSYTYKAYIIDAMLAALTLLHDDKLIHSDVKSRNFLLKVTDGAITTHLIDFGDVLKEGIVYKRPGTMCYIPPEVILRSRENGIEHGPSRDMWALGHVITELAIGKSPSDAFDEACANGSKNQINKLFEQSTKDWNSHVKSEMIDQYGINDRLLYLAYQLMMYDPPKRLTANEARSNILNLLKV